MTVSDVSAIIGSVVAVGTLVLAIGRFWIARIEKRSQRVALKLEEILNLVGETIERQFANADKTTYVTIDYRMDGIETFLRIPLAVDRVTECLPGMRLQLIEQNATETVYSISTLASHQPLRFHWHYHEETETVQVIRGSVTDVKTGRRYTAGETWIIPSGERHIADFDGAYVLATLRPPLPFAIDAPIRVEGLAHVYDAAAP